MVLCCLSVMFRNPAILTKQLTQFAVHLLTTTDFIYKLPLKNVDIWVQLQFKDRKKGHRAISADKLLSLHSLVENHIHTQDAQKKNWSQWKKV